MSRFCRNPRCGDWTLRNRSLCPSCRLAATGGAGVALICFVVGHILASVDWLPVLKAVLHHVFE